MLACPMDPMNHGMNESNGSTEHFTTRANDSKSERMIEDSARSVRMILHRVANG